MSWNVIFHKGDFDGLQFPYSSNEPPAVFIAYRCEPGCTGHVTTNGGDPDITNASQAYVLEKASAGMMEQSWARYSPGPDEPEDPELFLKRFQTNFTSV